MSDDPRDRIFEALCAAMPEANLAAARRCAARLRAELPHPEPHRNLVLVAFGGGKDSAYTLAFVRAMQLILHRSHGTTFRMRVATNRHAGMPRAVMDNIDRAYRALGVTDDPDCEPLLIDGDEVTRFDVDTPQPDHIVRRNRLDILMTGHRTFADGRPTFCNACNLSVANSFGLAAAYGEGADVIITGDSEREQRQYALWIHRLARRVGAPTAGPAGRGPRGLGRVLSQLDAIARAYFTDIHGPDGADAGTDAVAQRRVMADVPAALRFFSIYSDTRYDAGDHMELLTGLLGFRFDDIAFSFTESDCGNPALMAHLRGLKCERVYGRPYADGLAEYVAFALDLMRKKDFPPDLVELMRIRYDGPDAVDAMRRSAAEYARQTFGLDEQQLVCMVYSPFAEKAAGLRRFLTREHPALVDRHDDIHTLLAGGPPSPDPAGEWAGELAGELERISGLNPRQLAVLYSSPVRRPVGGRPAVGATEVIDSVLEGDPHKAVIRTRHAPDGPYVLEQISGR
jgi:hypothetical protein